MPTLGMTRDRRRGRDPRRRVRTRSLRPSRRRGSSSTTGTTAPPRGDGRSCRITSWARFGARRTAPPPRPPPLRRAVRGSSSRRARWASGRVTRSPCCTGQDSSPSTPSSRSTRTSSRTSCPKWQGTLFAIRGAPPPSFTASPARWPTSSSSTRCWAKGRGRAATPPPRAPRPRCWWTGRCGTWGGTRTSLIASTPTHPGSGSPSSRSRRTNRLSGSGPASGEKRRGGSCLTRYCRSPWIRCPGASRR
mmetsp:Transcript_20443/g.43847  ORF Transcript_20443/g.43847 Transcript_20443/m.43847 type:complete len:248 (-) Transcript_20443:921-1664(-)